jgi:glyoxylase-like metal-dependent hydrolase (beta-lactamase superfamily II)
MLKLILIILGGILAVLLIPVILLGIGSLIEIQKMMKLVSKTSKILSDVFTILDGHANVYFIKNKDGYIAIDGGEKPKVTLREMKKIGIKPSEVKHLFLTHSDFDHAGAIEIFTDAKVYLSKEESKLLTGEYKRTFGKFKISLKNKVKHSYSTLKDNEIINCLGRKVECFFDPGTYTWQYVVLN